MKRYAILLGHSDGELATQIDLLRVYNFLISLKGGAWNDKEICCKKNMSIERLITLINQIKKSNIDYLFFYFSGHGKFKRSSVLELNPNGETIDESVVSGLVPRQLNIYDCCRTLSDEIISEETQKGLFSENTSNIQYFRLLYENRIMQAFPQQMSLYSCEVGECSYDFGYGGIFTTQLLKTTKEISDRFLPVSDAFLNSFNPTMREAGKHGVEQHPDYFMAKLPTAKQLILAVDDKYRSK